MSKRLRRFLNLVIVFCVCITMLPSTMQQVSAASLSKSQFDTKLSSARSSYPTGSQKEEWSVNGSVVGWQCHGYGRWLSWYVWGVDFANGNGSGWTLLKSTSSSSYINSLAPGDIVRYRRISSTGVLKSWNHTIFITSISGDNIYYTDCNSDGACTILWDQKISKSTLDSYLKLPLYKKDNEAATYGYIAHYTPNTLSGSSSHTTHSYSGSYYEAAHPHRIYQQCSCGATKYTGTYKTVSSCSSCSFTQDTKYKTVKGFKAYPCVTSNFEVKTSDLSTRAGEIYTTDFCTINEIYTNGWCKVTFPLDSGGTKTAYTKISNFIKTPSTSLTKYTASSYINLYSKASLSTQIYRIYPGDVCYTIGTSGSATQIFMPLSSGGYVLGWVSTSALSSSSSSTEKLSPGLTSLTSSSYAKCYTITNGKYNVYTSSALTTRGYEGTASSSAWTGESDEIWIIGVGVNSAGTAYAKIKYPVGDSRYIAYVPLHSTLVPGSLNGSYRTAVAKVSGFSDRPGGTTNSSYWVESGEKVYLLSQQNGYSQILYPTSSGVWRIAWCTNSVYNSMFKAQTYTVTYNANGGTGAPSAQTKTRDVDLTLSSIKPTRTGYTFVGWATSSSATTAKYSAGSIYTNEASVTLYAVWRKKTFTITYNANGGVNAPGAQTQTYGTAITVTSDQPEKTYTVNFNANGGTVDTSYYSLDCTFASWNTNKGGTGTTVKSGASYKPNVKVTLYAIYTNPTLGNYPIPSREGYTFNGWYTAESGGTRVDATTVITANTTLYAQWSLETYSVIYFDDGSLNIPNEQTKTYGTALTLSSEVPVKEGYTFKGWATEEGSTTVVYSPAAQYTNNEWLILYAVWEKNPATLSSIDIDSMPTKTTYHVGDTLDTSGLKLKLTYSDGTTEFVTSGFTTSGFDFSTAGEKKVTISYGEKTTSFSVTVEEVVDETASKIIVESKAATAGETIQITVALENNPGIAGLAISLNYDENVLTLKETENGSLFSGFTAAKNFAWDESEDVLEDGVLAIFTFEVAEDAQAGDYNIEVLIRSCTNENLDDVELSTISGKVSVINFLYGDANGDQKIDMKDVVLIRKYITNFDYDTNTSSVNVTLGADANGDNKIDMKDVVILRKYITNYDYDTESSTVVLGPQ